MSPISNETFEHFKTKEKLKEITKCINILKSNGFTIIDSEGNVIKRETELKKENN